METDKVIKFKPRLIIRKYTSQEEQQDSPSKIYNIFSSCKQQQSESGSKSSASEKDFSEDQPNLSQIVPMKQILANSKIIQRRRSFRRFKNQELQNAINNGIVKEISYDNIIEDIQTIKHRINSCEQDEKQKQSFMPPFLRLQQERQQKQLETIDKYESIWVNTEQMISQKLQRKPNETLMSLSAIKHRQKVEKAKIVQQLLQKQSATTNDQYFASTLRQTTKKKGTPLPEIPHIAESSKKQILESSFQSSTNQAKENKRVKQIKPKLIYIERQGKPNCLGNECQKMHEKLVKFIDTTLQNDEQYENFSVKYYDPEFQDLQVKGQNVLQKESKVYYNLNNMARTSSFYKFLNIKEDQKVEKISEYFTKKQLDVEYVVAYEKLKTS